MAVVPPVLAGVLVSAVIVGFSCCTAEGAFFRRIQDWTGAFVGLAGNQSQRNGSAKVTHGTYLAHGNETSCKRLLGKTVHERLFNALSTTDLVHRPLVSCLGMIFRGRPGCEPRDMPCRGATLHERFLQAARSGKWERRLNDFVHALSDSEWLQELKSSRMNILLLPFLLSFIMGRLRSRGPFELKGSCNAGGEEDIGELSSFDVAPTAGSNNEGKEADADEKKKAPVQMIQRSRLTQLWRSSPDSAVCRPGIAIT